MPCEKKWCSTVQNGISGAHCPEHLRRAHKAQVLGSLPVDTLTLPRGWPNCHGACSASHWSCDTLESCNHLQKCPSEIERGGKAEGKGGGKWTPGAVTREFTYDDNNLNSLSSGFCSQDHLPISTSLVCGAAHFKTIKHQEFLVLLFTARSGSLHYCQKLSIIKLLQLLVHH